MSNNDLPIIVAGGGIGGIAAALALVRQGFSVKVLEQASHLGEIGNPFAVIHRADAHQSLLDGINIGVANKDQIELLTGTTVTRVARAENSVTDVDAKGEAHRGAALIAADGVKSAIRKQFVGDAARVSDHVVYRAVVEKKDFPQDFQWNAASIWVGPNCHLVHYPKGLDTLGHG